MSDTIDSYGFHFLNAVAPAVLQLHGIGIEHRFEDYDFDNTQRAVNQWLFQYTLSGHGMLILGEQRAVLKAGTGFLLKLPGNSRYFLPKPPTGGWRFIWLMFSGQAADAYGEHIHLKRGKILALSPDSPAITALTKLHGLAASGKLRNSLTAQEITYQFLCRLCNERENPPEAMHPLVQNALQIIQTEFAALEGAADIAKRLGVTPEHLSRLVAAQTGSTLIALLTRARLRHAAQLLLESTLTLDEIAGLCGYTNANYLGKAFTRAMGCPPGHFRRNAKALGYLDVLL